MKETESERTRRRWITFGELIALAALIISALGVWISWKSSGDDKPTRIVEQRSAIPLALRATVSSDGSVLTFVPADPAHALERATAPERELLGEARLAAATGTGEGEQSRRQQQLREIIELAPAADETSEVHRNV